MAKKAGSDGQIRKTQAEWDADTGTYLEGMRLMNTDTGVVRISKGGTTGTYAQAWTPSTGGSGASNTDELTNNSTVSGSTTTDALNTLLGADQSLDDEKQDRLLSILTINNDNHTLLGTEYFIRATGSDPTWVTDTGNLSAGYPLELANDSTNDLTFVPDSGSNIVLPPGARASLRHRSGGSWISMFSGVDTALAAKADALIVPRVITGDTAYSAGDKFIVNNGTEDHPTYTGPASPSNGQQFIVFSSGADMNFDGNGISTVREGTKSALINIGTDSSVTMIYSTTEGHYLITSIQGTIT